MQGLFFYLIICFGSTVYDKRTRCVNELFTEMIQQAAKSVHKRLRQVEYRTQAPDHPILWAAEESYYLKFYIFQVCDEK